MSLRVVRFFIGKKENPLPSVAGASTQLDLDQLERDHRDVFIDGAVIVTNQRVPDAILAELKDRGFIVVKGDVL